MITRIIKLKVKDSPQEFINYMSSLKSKFESVEGCKQIEILRGKIDDNIFFIYTIWKSETVLNKFRKSDLNKEFWNKLQEISTSRPQAWSVENIFEK